MLIFYLKKIFFYPNFTVFFCIFYMRLIFGTQILAYVVLAKNEELDIHSVN